MFSILDGFSNTIGAILYVTMLSRCTVLPSYYQDVIHKFFFVYLLNVMIVLTSNT